jgi:pimeloyl-ACP methyl ester carboxylesterase
MPGARLDGLDVSYEDTGGSGPVLLFSHGFLMDREMWAPQIAALRGRYRCISWDQRGFGRTGPVERPFSYWDSARDALGLLQHLTVATATFIGLSQGAFLAMRAALLEPARVKALVLMSTRAGLDTAETIGNFKNLRQEWGANGATNVAPMLGEILIGTERADPQPWFAKWAKMSKQALAHPIDALTGRDDLTPRLSELRCPALVIHGDADIAIDIAHGEALAKGLPNCQGFVRVPGAGHAPNLTHPDLVNPPLTEFLARWA